MTVEADAADITGAIIDRFGGIRPMATKLATPVTTVQGWKKRGIIPQNRHPEILMAAQREGIALEPEELAATDPVGSARPDARAPEAGFEPAEPMAVPSSITVKRGSAAANMALAISLLVAAAVVGTALAGWHLVVVPLRERVAILEGRGGGAQSENLTRRIAALEGKLSQPAAPAPAGQASSGVDRDRLAAIDRQLAELKASAAQSEQIAKGLSDLQIAAGGRELLAQSMRDLQSSIAANQGEIERMSGQVAAFGTRLDKVDAALADRRQQALRTESAILSIGQLRAQLATSRPYAKELAAVRSLTGSDAEMSAQLDQLQPFADSGVPSSDDIAGDFKRLAPELVRSAVVGDGQSWWRQALYHLESVVSIRRVGNNVPGDKADAIVARAEGKLDEDDLPGAVAALQALSGAPAELASPWLHDADHRMAVDTAESEMTRIAIGRLAEGTVPGQSAPTSTATTPAPPPPATPAPAPAAAAPQPQSQSQSQPQQAGK